MVHDTSTKDSSLLNNDDACFKDIFYRVLRKTFSWAADNDDVVSGNFTYPRSTAAHKFI